MGKRELAPPRTAEDLAAEAVRLYENARKTIRAIPIRQNRYTDTKPVREACGTAYLAVLAAIHSFLLAQGVHPSKVPESYEAYGAALARHTARNGKVKSAFFDAYSQLHLDGYYRGFTSVDYGKLGFQNAKFLIERLTGRKVNGV